MRPVLFVVCFCLGVSLMVASGYLPKSATGQSGLTTAGSSTVDVRPAVDRPEPVFTGAPTIPRAPLPDDDPAELPSGPSPEVYTPPPAGLPGDAPAAHAELESAEPPPPGPDEPVRDRKSVV